MLAHSAFAERCVRLSWTTPGDDDSRGIPYEFDLRYSGWPITEENFARNQNAARIQAMLTGRGDRQDVEGRVAACEALLDRVLVMHSLDLKRWPRIAGASSVQGAMRGHLDRAPRFPLLIGPVSSPLAPDN